jgi:uncharacterized membrane protein
MSEPQPYSLRWPVVLTALLLCFVGTNVAYAGFGITPPYVRNDRLTQGSVYTQEITLVRGDPVEDLKAEITFNIPGINEWFSVDKGMEFLLPAGEKQIPILFTVQVPDNASYERYQGSIRIRTLSPDQASGVSIALGAQIDVDLRVVDEIRDFEVKRVKISETEEPRKMWWLEYPGKITFSMGIENTGNAATAPSRVQLDIYDKRGNVVLETTYNSNDIEEILPFETKEVQAYLPTRLPPGAYLVKYSIFRFEDEVKRSGELTLSVLPQGTLTSYVGYGIEGLSMNDLLTLVVPIVVVVLVLLGVTFVMQMRRKNKRKRRHERVDRNDDDDEPRKERRSLPPVRESPDSRSGGGVVDLSRGRRSR